MKLQLNEETLTALVPEAKNLNSFPRKKKKKMKKLVAKKIEKLLTEFQAGNFELPKQ